MYVIMYKNGISEKKLSFLALSLIILNKQFVLLRTRHVQLTNEQLNRPIFEDENWVLMYCGAGSGNLIGVQYIYCYYLNKQLEYY